MTWQRRRITGRQLAHRSRGATAMWGRVVLEGAREILTRRGQAFLALVASTRDGATGSHLS